MGYDWGWSWGMAFGMLFMVLFWVFIVALAVWLVTTFTRQRETGTPDRAGRGTARAILEERLARGEIDVEEFRARAAALDEVRR